MKRTPNTTIKRSKSESICRAGLALSLILASGILPMAANAVSVHVSPTGNDSCDGSSASPVATALCARDRARSLRATGEKSPIEIIFADGKYRMSAPLVLDVRDSGVRWRAANHGKAILSGGIVPEWRRKDASLIVASIPGDWPIPGFAHGGNKDLAPDCPVAVYAGKHRLPCARWPNGRDWAKTGLSFGGKASTNKWGRGTFTSGEYRFNSPRLAVWSKEKDIWVCGGRFLLEVSLLAVDSSFHFNFHVLPLQLLYQHINHYNYIYVF